MNKVILIGRPTDTPKVTTNGDTTVARYTVAVDRYGDGADFISCVAFNKQAEFVDKYVNKGQKIAIEGHIQTGSYVNKDGNKVYTTDVVVERHEFCESKRSEDAPTQTSNDDFMTIPDNVAEELPWG